MGKMTRQQVVDILTAAVKFQGQAAKIQMYADSYMSYQAAVENIRKNGDIVFHPRTGAPIENPYCGVRSRAMTEINKIGSMAGSDALWTADSTEVAE